MDQRKNIHLTVPVEINPELEAAIDALVEARVKGKARAVFNADFEGQLDRMVKDKLSGLSSSWSNLHKIAHEKIAIQTQKALEEYRVDTSMIDHHIQNKLAGVQGRIDATIREEVAKAVKALDLEQIAAEAMQLVLSRAVTEKLVEKAVKGLTGGE